MINFNNVDHNIKLDSDVVYRDNVNLPIFRFDNLMETGISSALKICLSFMVRILL